MSGISHHLLSAPSKSVHKYVLLLITGLESEHHTGLLTQLSTTFLNHNVHITTIESLPTFSGLVSFKLSLVVSSHDVAEAKMREQILETIQRRPVDFMLCDEDEYNCMNIKLAGFDMDSCILGHECIDELAEEMGVSERVKDITRRAMAGELEFDDALRERVALLQGMKESQLETVWLRLHLNPGAVSLIQSLKASGVKIALISGGFTYFAHRVAERLGIDYAFSNTLEFDHNRQLTGRVSGPIVNGNRKEEIVRALAIREDLSMRNVVTMGDGANDQYMVRAAGLGIAYHGKAILKSATPHHIDHTPLHSLIHFANLPPTPRYDETLLGKVRLESLPPQQGFPVSSSLAELLSSENA